MFDKFFSFFGFNSTQNLVGLSQIKDNSIKPKAVNPIQPKKELKLSDLMRGQTG